MNVSTRILTDKDLEDALPALAHLRISVFSAYPYLYAGTSEYELDYLRTFAKARDAVIVAAIAQDKSIVGCATGSAISDHHEGFAKPLEDAGIDLASTFYFGESVLLPEWRGNGIGHRFFDAREQHARAGKYKRACFCAVSRLDTHPQRPVNYTPLDNFWHGRGYVMNPEISASFEWPETPEGPSLPHLMRFWFKDLA